MCHYVLTDFIEREISFKLRSDIKVLIDCSVWGMFIIEQTRPNNMSLQLILFILVVIFDLIIINQMGYLCKITTY